MTDSEKIVKLLERENLTAKQCADIIGITRSSMSHIINGRNNPSLDVMRKSSKTFPISILSGLFWVKERCIAKNQILVSPDCSIILLKLIHYQMETMKTTAKSNR